jgi:hypothetical protein
MIALLMSQLECRATGQQSHPNLSRTGGIRNKRHGLAVGRKCGTLLHAVKVSKTLEFHGHVGRFQARMNSGPPCQTCHGEQHNRYTKSRKQTPPPERLSGIHDACRERGAASGIECGDHGIELECQIACGLKSFRGIFLQTAPNNSLDGRHGFCGSRQRRRVFSQDGTDQIGERRAAKGAIAGEHFVQHGAKTEDIGARISSKPHHVPGGSRARDRPRPCRRHR